MNAFMDGLHLTGFIAAIQELPKSLSYKVTFKGITMADKIWKKKPGTS